MRTHMRVASCLPETVKVFEGARNDRCQDLITGRRRRRENLSSLPSIWKQRRGIRQIEPWKMIKPYDFIEAARSGGYSFCDILDMLERCLIGIHPSVFFYWFQRYPSIDFRNAHGTLGAFITKTTLICIVTRGFTIIMMSKQWILFRKCQQTLSEIFIWHYINIIGKVITIQGSGSIHRL